MSSYKAVRKNDEVEKFAGWKKDPIRGHDNKISKIVVPFFRFSSFIERGKDGSMLDEMERNRLKSILEKEISRFKNAKNLS